MNTNKSLKVLVTGGAGFIGSALARHLKDAGHSVVVIDNYNTYYDVTLKQARSKEFLQDIEVIEADITDKTQLQAVFATHQFEVVCHLAGYAGVRYSIEQPQEYIQNNITGTINLFECMRTHGVGRMVFASSSSVYGNDTTSPFTEDAAAAQPISVYGATKRTCEMLAYTYFNLYGIQSTCFRFFTVYGPWSRPDMAMLKFAELITAGQPIDIYNHGKLRRDFTHVSDIVTGFALGVEKPLEYEIINLGRGQSTDLMTYIELLEQALGVKAKKNFLPMQPGDVYETYADTEKAKELLGFEATVSIAEGVKTFADWYKAYFKNEV